MTALDAQEGDIAIISAGADKGSYILGDGPSTSFDSWLLLAVESNAPVQSVNGQTGTILLAPSDIGAAPESHSHTIAQITNLQTTLNQKADADHTHSISNITGLEVALNGKAHSSHNHTTAQITGLDTALAGKSNTGHTHDGADITGALTDQLALSAALVPDPSNDFETPYPLGTFVQQLASGLAGYAPMIDALESGKSDVGHTHTTAQITGLDSALSGKVIASGAASTLWAGSQSAYDDLPEAPRNAVGFVAVII